MVEPKVTTMVIKVDLQCRRCYKKIKKVLCKFPQIRDQVYDEKNNTVTIKVVCCSPEKIKQKICCKGGECVKGIEIIVPKPPPPPEIPKPPKKPDPPPVKETPKKPEPAPCCKPVLVPVAAFPIGVCCTECSKGRCRGPCYHGCGFPRPPLSEKPKETPKKTEPAPCYPIGVCCTDCYEGRTGGPCYHGCELPPPPPPSEKPKETPKKTEPAPCYPIGVCCTECSEGRGGGPCYRGCGYPPPRFYEGYCGRPVCDSWADGYRGGYYVCEENASACSIM